LRIENPQPETIMSALRFGLFVACALAVGVATCPAAPPPVVRRDWLGDPLPMGAVARLGTLRQHRLTEIQYLVFTPDSSSLLAVPSLGIDCDWRLTPRLWLWDVRTGKLVRRLGGEQWAVPSVAFSSRGDLTVTSEEKGVFLWDTVTGRLIRPLLRTKKNNPYTDVAFLLEGKSVVCVADGGIETRAIADGRQLRRVALPDLDEIVHAHQLSFSPGGKILARTEMSGRRAMVWDVATGKVLGRFATDENAAVAFHPGGKVFAIGGGTEKTVQIRDATSLRVLREWKLGNEEHDRVLDRSCLAFSPTDSLLAARADEKSIGLWDWTTGKLVRKVQATRFPLSALAFSPDGKILASAGDGRVRLWDVATGHERILVEGHQRSIVSLSYQKDGRLVSSDSGGTMHTWDVPSGRHLRVRQRTSRPAVSSTEGNPWANWEEDGDIVLTDAWSGRLYYTLNGHREFGGHVAFSADYRIVVTTGDEGVIRIWDVGTGKLRRKLEHLANRDCLVIPALSADGRLLAARGRHGVLQVWDTTTGALIRELTTESDTITSLVFTPDAKALVSGGVADPVRLWEIATGRQLLHSDLAPEEKQDVCTVAIACSRDGRLIAAAGSDNTVQLWEVASGREVCRFPREVAHIHAVAFSPDGRFVASGGEDHTILVWGVTAFAPGFNEPDYSLGTRREILWKALADAEDAAKAFRAAGEFAHAPTETISFLANKMCPTSVVAPEHLNRWVADLDADEFDTRERASRKLAEAGEQATPILRRALGGNASAEVKHRARDLVEGYHAAERLPDYGSRGR
jgi:WD40 repeat protein